MKEKPIPLTDWKVRVLPHATQIRVPIDTKDKSIKRVFWADNHETVPPGRHTGWVKECDAPLLIAIDCPYPIGTKLWVKEAFGLIHLADGCPIFGDISDCEEGSEFSVHYKIGASDFEESLFPKWRSARTMPRWASRYTLEVTGVKEERVQEISEEDAKAEGVPASDGVVNDDGSPSYRFSFMNRWTLDHGIDNPESWDSNPWCWVLSVKTLEDGHV